MKVGREEVMEGERKINVACVHFGSVMQCKDCGSRTCRKEARGRVVTESQKEHKHENPSTRPGRR